MRHLAEGAEPVDHGLLQRADCSRGLAGSRQMPAEKLAGVAALDLRRRKVKSPIGLSYRCLALNDLDHRRCLALGRPAFDAVVHRHTQRYLFHPG